MKPGHVYQRHGRRISLTVIDSNEPRWVPDGKMPASRAECPDTSVTMCGAVQCRHHLFRVDSCDRAGRPSIAKVKRSGKGTGRGGWTESVTGDLGDERAGTTLDPLWLDENGEFRFVETCSLNVANRGAHSDTATGALAGRHRTLIAREVKKAARKVIENGGTEEGLRLLCDPESANENREPSKRQLRG